MASGETVLLVEDDPDVAAVLREFLEDKGFTLAYARTAGEGRDALQAMPIALVVLDLMLPDDAALEFLSELPHRAGPPDIIVITGYPTLESAIAALEAGAAGYLIKPLDLPRLAGQLTALLERRRIAADNERLNTEIAERLREQDAVRAISSALTETLDVSEALRRTCRELARLTGADTASVHLHDRATDQLVPLAAYHVPGEYLQSLAGTPLPLRGQEFYHALWRERRPVFSDDVAHDPRFGDSLFRLFPHQSGLLLPLVLDGEVAGAFYLVWWHMRRVFADREVTLLEGVCEQVSLLLRNARLYEQTERDRSRLETLNDVSRQLAVIHDTEHVLSLIVHEAARLLDAEAAGLRLLDGDDLVVGARTPLAEPLMVRERLKVGEGFSGHVVSTGAPLVVDDLATAETFDRSYIGAILDQGFHAYVGVPLRVNERTVGALSVYSRRARRFPADEVALLEAFADQASLAIDKASLLRKAEDARNLLARLYRVGTTMQLSWDRSQRIEAFIQGAHDVVGFDRVSVMLASRDGTALELIRLTGQDSVPPISVPLTPAGGVINEVFRTRRPAVVLGEDELEAIPPLDPAFRSHPYFRTTRFVVWPLIAGERAIGVTVADNKPTRRPIDPATLEPYGLLCHQFAAALEEARLYADSQAREREATRFAEITAELAASLDLDRVLDRILEQAVGLLGGDASAIMRHDAARGGLTFLRARGYDPNITRDLVLRPGDGVAGRAYQERRAVWTQDRLTDPEFRLTRAAERLANQGAPRAALAVPVISRSEIFGVLVGYFADPHAFTDGEVRLLDTLAHHAAITLENARLFEETRTQRTRLGQILDSTSDGIALVDANGRILSANPRAAELLAAPLPDGTDFLALLDAIDPGTSEISSGVGDFRALLAAGDRGGEGDIVLREFQRVIHWVAQPTKDVSRRTMEFTLTLQDVTREREISQMKSDFVSFATHQLRTPLTGINWLLELAGRHPGADPTLLEYVDDARQAAQRLIGLVNDLLDVSRLEGGKLAVTVRETRLSDVTTEVLNELDGLLRQKGHRLTVAGGEGLPDLMVDPQLLRQVVLNLVSNAVKYTPAGGEIAIRMTADDGAVQWSITDSGLGVPLEAQRRLFEKFYRAENVVTLEPEGTGLGLYLVKLIVERFGGRVWCESSEGTGATFAFRLPCGHD